MCIPRHPLISVNYHPSLRACCLAILLLVHLLASPRTCEAQNLVTNPSFETEAGTPDMADGWEQFALGGEVVRLTELPNTGDAHIRLTGDPMDGANFAVLVQRDLPVAAESGYELDLFVRGDPVDGQVGYRVEFYNGGGGLIGGMFDNNVFINSEITTDYQEFSSVFAAPANAASGTIVVFWEVLNGLTSIDVDDVSFALVGVGTPGDFDTDGDVDGTDYLVWQRDPAVGSLTDWQTNYGSGSLTAIASVPEPAMAALLSLAILCATATRKRQL